MKEEHYCTTKPIGTITCKVNSIDESVSIFVCDVCGNIYFYSSTTNKEYNINKDEFVDVIWIIEFKTKASHLKKAKYLLSKNLRYVKLNKIFNGKK